MSTTDNTNGVNLASGVKVFDDLTQFENSGLECPVLLGDMGGSIGKAKLKVVRDVLRGTIEANEAGFPTGGAVFIALQPVSEHLDDTVKHITAEERAAWNAKYTAAAVDEKIVTALATAKAYADEKTQVLSDTFTAALADAVAGLREDIQTAIRELIDNAPEAMNSLKELSAALGDNPNFATEIATALGQRVTIEALKAELAGYVPKTGDTTIVGTLTATDFMITE